MAEPLISICIPAYRKAGQLAKLLESVLMQDFRDFELIVSDDSPDDAVRQLCVQYQQKLPIQYYHNQPALGSPENWNNAIRLARGQWIKLMHDDDAFAAPDSLRKLYELTGHDVSFVFCGYQRVASKGVLPPHSISAGWVQKIRKDPRLLMVHNVIGHPSVTLHRNMPGMLYDQRMKWMVDIDLYIRFLQAGSFRFSPEQLVLIGHNEQQLTHTIFTNKKVVVPENLLLLEKLGIDLLDKILVYDYCWRLMRNYSVEDMKELQALSPVPVPVKLERLLRFQRLFPAWLLNWGPASKALMLMSWLLNR